MLSDDRLEGMVISEFCETSVRLLNVTPDSNTDSLRESRLDNLLDSESDGISNSLSDGRSVRG